MRIDSSFELFNTKTEMNRSVKASRLQRHESDETSQNSSGAD